MLATMKRTTDKVIGYTISGDMTKADYQTLVPAVSAAIEAQGSVSVLFNLTGFHWEKVSAWGSDLNFGKQFHDKIDKMAIVGDKKWESHIAKLAQPYYAKDAKVLRDRRRRLELARGMTTTSPPIDVSIADRTVGRSWVRSVDEV